MVHVFVYPNSLEYGLDGFGLIKALIFKKGLSTDNVWIRYLWDI